MQPDQGTPAGDDLADDRGGRAVDRRRDGGRHPLGAAAATRSPTARRWAARWCWSRRRNSGSGWSLLYLFSRDIGKFKIFPGAGSYVGITDDPWKWFTSLMMPWFVLAAGSAAVFARLIRGSLLEMMDEDYIRTARAKGLPERRRRAPGSARLDQPGRHPAGPRNRRSCSAARCWSRRSSTSPASGRSPTSRSSTRTSK